LASVADHRIGGGPLPKTKVVQSRNRQILIGYKNREVIPMQFSEEADLEEGLRGSRVQGGGSDDNIKTRTHI